MAALTNPTCHAEGVKPPTEPPPAGNLEDKCNWRQVYFATVADFLLNPSQAECTYFLDVYADGIYDDEIAFSPGNFTYFLDLAEVRWGWMAPLAGS